MILNVSNRGRRLGVWAVLVVILPFSGWTLAESFTWRAAKSADTAEDYRRFLKRHWLGLYSAKATLRLNQLESLAKAEISRSPDAYEDVIRRFPGSDVAARAKTRLDNTVLKLESSQIEFVDIPPGEFDMGVGDEEKRALLEPSPIVIPPGGLTTAVPAGSWGNAASYPFGMSPMDRNVLLTNIKNASPVHHVVLTKGYQLGRYEITQAQWFAVMKGNPSKFVRDNRPVERVSWLDVQEFIAKVNSLQDGWLYRLPTEAEWEYACRAGTKSLYFWGDAFDDAYVVYGRDEGGFRRLETAQVGKRKPNAWGLYDMVGNVSEWCQDFFTWGGEYYAECVRGVADPAGPPHSGTIEQARDFRVERGGYFESKTEGEFASFARGVSQQSERSYLTGFRLARSKRR